LQHLVFLKPVKIERFNDTINQVMAYWEMKQNAIAYTVLFQKQTITIKEGHNKVYIPLKDINYLEAMKDHTQIITAKKSTRP